MVYETNLFKLEINQDIPRDCIMIIPKRRYMESDEDLAKRVILITNIGEPKEDIKIV
jgi:hypothetical protein